MSVPDRASRARRAESNSLPLRRRLGLVDVLLETAARSGEELGRNLAQIRDDTGAEHSLLLGRRHLLQFGGSHNFRDTSNAYLQREIGCIDPRAL
jgi:hypothetical protein